MKKSAIGILAHVDAGKTTLAEAILYKAGVIRKAGRVDHGSTLLDTHTLERERGITIFSSQAVFHIGDKEITLLDTPGHVDFSSETERTLQILDYAILVISGTDGVQAHTRTLWQLLSIYNIPTFIFVTKMDFARHTKEELMSNIQKELSADCIDFSSENRKNCYESLACCREDILDKYLENGVVSDTDIAQLIRNRLVFPCMFGSGLKFSGIDEFLSILDTYISPSPSSEVFGARVFKISYDEKGARLTHMKITGGKLAVRDIITCGEKEEKVSQIRIYSGAKYITTDEAESGTVCAVTGLSSSVNGQGLGHEFSAEKPILEPVINYRIVLPHGCDANTALPKLALLQEEDPLLHINWNSNTHEINVGLMGEIQAEILKSIIRDRFDIEVQIEKGRVLYKETIEDTVEGVGHYEPLRHYAEVHLLMEPLPRGSGLKFSTNVNEDLLDRNWQRLVLMHLQEKRHLGVLTRSPITDMKITLAAGRAHIKHTEGGDFRQATYRAVRQGLMSAKSKLLEPYYSFRLELPCEYLGRAINDIRMLSGTFESPENIGETVLIKGKAPVTTLNGYAAKVAAYSGGKGRLFCEIAGYFDCHNADKVIADINYNPETDLENTADSVFCAHGGGFGVKWNKVPEYMHLESVLKKDRSFSDGVNRRNFHIDDKELEAIMEREFGKVKYELYRPNPLNASVSSDNIPDFAERRQYVIVDGYNVIFAWDELRNLASDNLGAAREKLMHILCNYAAYTKNNIILVFDAYRVPGNNGERFNFNNIHVVYTKEHELGDVYIEKLISEIGKNDKVRIVTSDGLIQLSAVRSGVLRVSASEFEQEMNNVYSQISSDIDDLKFKTPKNKIGDSLRGENPSEK